uniref:Putative tick kunitz 85 n=1 Tax=Ixodes ricinus TaxID=34613 RepID=V5HCS1_IXORI
MKVLLVSFLVGTVAAQWNEICKLSPDKGLCRGRISRFYFDQSSGICLPFIYGGCMGNPNNFWTILDCEAACKNSVQDEPPEDEEGSSYFDTACRPHPGERNLQRVFGSLVLQRDQWSLRDLSLQRLWRESQRIRKQVGV